MTLKDWILLVFPIVMNGIFLYLIQKIINTKLENINKRNSLRDKTVLSFYEALQTLNKIFIEVNIEAQNNPDSIPEGLKKIIKHIIFIIQFYDTNIYDLKEFEKKYNFFNEAWEDFIKTYKKNIGKTLSDLDKKELGEKMQISKDKLSDLLGEVREKY